MASSIPYWLHCGLKAYRRKCGPVQLYGEMHRFVPVIADGTDSASPEDRDASQTAFEISKFGNERIAGCWISAGDASRATCSALALVRAHRPGNQLLGFLLLLLSLTALLQAG